LTPAADFGVALRVEPDPSIARDDEEICRAGRLSARTREPDRTRLDGKLIAFFSFAPARKRKITTAQVVS
jgi:hypothetical protein